MVRVFPKRTVYCRGGLPGHGGLFRARCRPIDANRLLEGCFMGTAGVVFCGTHWSKPQRIEIHINIGILTGTKQFIQQAKAALFMQHPPELAT